MTADYCDGGYKKLDITEKTVEDLVDIKVFIR